MAEAFSIARKVALPGGGEGKCKIIAGVTGGTAHAHSRHLAEIIFYKDRYDACDANEKTAFDAMAISDLLAADFAGG